MKTGNKYKVVNIEDKTRYKLIFIRTFLNQHFVEFGEKKRETIIKEIDIVERLLNKEPVSATEYQTIMTSINDIIKNEKVFNDHIRRIRNES